LVAQHSLRSLSVPYLYSVLCQAGHEAYVIYFKATMGRPAPRDLQKFSDVVAELDPDVVGFSVMSALYREAVDLSAIVREQTRAKVLWGGIHPTLLPAECLAHADAVCVGEGDEAILDYVTAIESGGDTSAIPNIWVRRNGEIISNDMRPLVRDLDSLPFPDFRGENKIYIDHGRVLDKFENERTMVGYPIMTSRGCLHSCTYCCNAVLRKAYRGKGPYVRRRSVDSVIDELVLAKQRYVNMNHVAIVDDSFMYNEEWIEEFAEKWREHVGLFMFAYSHPNLVKEKMIETLRSCGLIYTVMGVQSGSERLRSEYFNRRTPNEQILRAANIIHDAKVLLCIDLIVRVPFETDEDRMATLDLLASLPRPYQMEVFCLQHFPETALTQRALAEGVITPDEVEHRRQSGFEVRFESLRLTLTDEELRWDALYFLAKKRWVSKQFLMRLARSAFFARHIRMITRIMRLLPIDNYNFHQVTINSPLQKVYFGIYLLFRIRRHRRFAKVLRDVKYFFIVIRQKWTERRSQPAP
jgi:anaerobic magnesium-protoporphyrin IX monomethyl ester cyclase